MMANSLGQVDLRLLLYVIRLSRHAGRCDLVFRVRLCKRKYSDLRQAEMKRQTRSESDEHNQSVFTVEEVAMAMM